MSQLSLDRFVPALLLLIAVVISILYMMHVDVAARTHDLQEHINAMRPMFERGALPVPYTCWQCSQPPLYYVLSAIAWKFAQGVGMAEPLNAVALISLFSYWIYLYFVWRLFRENIRPRSVYVMALAVTVFWPLGFHMARVINNDVPLFMTQIAAFYYLLRWWKNPNRRDLLKALLWSALGVNFKVTGILMIATIGATVTYRWLKERVFFPRQGNLATLCLMLCVVILAAAPFARNYYYYYSKPAGERPQHIILTGIQDGGNVGNEPYHYLGFDLRDYLTQPFYKVYEDAGGRQYFWNAILKTSLFDEFDWESPRLALALSALELLMVLYVLITTIVVIWRKSASECGVILATAIGLQLLAVGIFRYLSAYSFTQEYRYIYTVTPIFVLAYAHAITWWQERGNKAMQYGGIGFGVVFAALSVAFITANL